MSIEKPTEQYRFNDEVRDAHDYRVGVGRHKASALRIATGVVAMVLFVVGAFFAGARLFIRHGGASTPFYGWMNLFLIIGAIGALVTGVVLIVKQRKRGGATPWLVGGFAGVVVVVCLVFQASLDSGLPGGPTLTLPPALGTLALAALVVVREKFRR